MKAKIHPQWYPEAQVVCACGNTFTTGSTKQKIAVEVCYKCHPLYTGEARFIDTKGRVDGFIKRQQFAKQYKTTAKSKKQNKTEKEERKVKSLKELLSES